ncbi:hypothetical protein NEOLEDRAFT_533441 [Neolentinus lepideus HHB14362 ss-1]|uniref:Uncharacterized protein n=1 Tax=Neolentinus lepideus HHB14362 ss-1 TaxID=1314782 RepID=A0A165R9S7_9AGAM|nr:hypothetical protein NEOLEDRAFT_533441 [Neolentinus lepideus HHB14362 ss-1]
MGSISTPSAATPQVDISEEDILLQGMSVLCYAYSYTDELKWQTISYKSGSQVIDGGDDIQGSRNIAKPQAETQLSRLISINRDHRQHRVLCSPDIASKPNSVTKPLMQAASLTQDDDALSPTSCVVRPYSQSILRTSINLSGNTFSLDILQNE